MTSSASRPPQSACCQLLQRGAHCVFINNFDGNPWPRERRPTGAREAPSVRLSRLTGRNIGAPRGFETAMPVSEPAASNTGPPVGPQAKSCPTPNAGRWQPAFRESRAAVPATPAVRRAPLDIRQNKRRCLETNPWLRYGIPRTRAAPGRASAQPSRPFRTYC